MALFQKPSNFSRIVRPIVPFPLRPPFHTATPDKKPAYHLDLPFDKLSIFARRYETAEILSGLPIFVVAELSRYDEPLETRRAGDDQPDQQGGGKVPDGDDNPVSSENRTAGGIPAGGGDQAGGEDPAAGEGHSGGQSGDVNLGQPDLPGNDGVITNPPLRRLDSSPPRQTKVHFPLGMLSTDHVGYASFDLTVLRTETVVKALEQTGVIPVHHKANSDAAGETPPSALEPPIIGIQRLWVLPFGDLALCSDAIANGDIGPDFLTLRLHLDQQRLSTRELYENTMPSMQSPGILDYRMSPGSFTVSPSMLVGTEASCASLLPSNLATQAFRFFQVARIPGKPFTSAATSFSGVGLPPKEWKFRLGYIFTYTTEWFPIGHSLGTLSYSLPLAPGEMVNIAIVDWSRSDVADRSEDTSFSESLQHRQLRDRSLSENVAAMLDEWQRGGSVMGGVAASGGANMGTYSAGGAASLGGAYTTSSGTRELTAETSQEVADAFHQSTTAMRELRSTVIVQGSQAETSRAQTRIVANYNHGHAMTILYYEVLRHYRVVTRVTNARLALLIDYNSFLPRLQDDGYLLSHRADLEMTLMDQALKPSFDAVARVVAGTARYEDAKSRWRSEVQPGEAVITQLKLTVTTGGAGDGGTHADVRMKLILFDGREPRVFMAVPSGHRDKTILDVEGTDIFEANHTDVLSLYTKQAFKWNELRSFVISNDRDWAGSGDWRVDHLKLIGRTQRAEDIVLYDAPYRRDIKAGEVAPEFPTVRPPQKSTEPRKDDFVNPAHAEAAQRLKDHYANHQFDYSREILLRENANARAINLDKMTLGDKSVLDLVENKAVEMTGNYMAFPIPSGRGDNSAAQLLMGLAGIGTTDVEDHLEDAYVEQLLSLPTRGVFAEAKLGSCNSNEKIDDTRHWDWQKSPIPHMAAEIAPVKTDSRDRPPTDLTPSSFPQNVVSIQAPQPLPDPTGLAAAIKAATTPDAFRDMSASDKVGSLLQNLSDNATKMASEGMKQSAKDQLLKNIREAPELSTEQKAKLVHDLFASDVAAAKQTDKPDTKPRTVSCSVFELCLVDYRWPCTVRRSF